jgi:hypothetical protein
MSFASLPYPALTVNYCAPLRSLVTFQSRAAAPASKPPTATMIVPIDDHVLSLDCKIVPSEIKMPPSVVFQFAIALSPLLQLVIDAANEGDVFFFFSYVY